MLSDVGQPAQTSTNSEAEGADEPGGLTNSDASSADNPALDRSSTTLDAINEDEAIPYGVPDPFEMAQWPTALVSAATGPTVPEPATWTLMLAGFAGLALACFRLKRRRGEPARAPSAGNSTAW